MENYKPLDDLFVESCYLGSSGNEEVLRLILRILATPCIIDPRWDRGDIWCSYMIVCEMQRPVGCISAKCTEVLKILRPVAYSLASRLRGTTRWEERHLAVGVAEQLERVDKYCDAGVLQEDHYLKRRQAQISSMNLCLKELFQCIEPQYYQLLTKSLSHDSELQVMPLLRMKVFGFLQRIFSRQHKSSKPN